MFTPIFSPLTHYQNTLRQRHQQNVKEYFALLESHANISREENAQTVAKYNEKQAQIQARQAKVSSNKRKRNWGIFGVVFFWLAIVITVFSIEMLPAIQAMISALTLGLSIFFIVRLCKSVNKENRELQTVIAALQDEANLFYSEAQKQAAPLNVLFTDEDALRLFEKSFPSVVFDPRFTDQRLNELVHGYGFSQNLSEYTCILDALSGELYGNPFLYETRRDFTMGTATYHGSLTIHWTTTETDSQGNRRTVSHSQTLHASITCPKPFYQSSTSLYFGNDNVPNVCFSRTHAHVEDKSESALDRTLRKGEKRLEKLQDKALEKDGDFTGVLNTDFEVLFNATNRTDEYEFREMFTPRAQESMLELLLDKDGYGDDFSFVKHNKLCTVHSEHAQYNTTISPFAIDFYSHDIAQIETSFLQKNEEFFRSVYFDFAPLLLIPPYQQPLVRSEKLQGGTATAYAYEALAYRLADYVCPTDATTPSIYKTSLVERQNGKDRVLVRAYAYKAEPRISYKSVYGRDGHWHDVPIDWWEYLPVQKTSYLCVGLAENKKSTPTNATYYRGYYAYVTQ